VRLYLTDMVTLEERAQLIGSINGAVWLMFTASAAYNIQIVMDVVKPFGVTSRFLLCNVFMES
jgi:hypothetical protein